MIHFTKEGGYKKIGLNLYRAPGGFVAVWAWYNFAKHEATTYRFRLRMHIKPRILWSVERFDVVEEYMKLWGCEMINSEVLRDLKAVEDQQKRTNVPYAYIKP